MTTIPQRQTAPYYVATHADAALAYYILAVLKPEMLHASPVVRASEIDRILAAVMSWRKGTGMLAGDRLDASAHQTILALMARDATATDTRRTQGGW